MYKLLTEILSTPHYCVRPGAFEGMRNAILGNIDGHLAAGVEKENHLQTFAVFRNGELTVCPQGLLDFKTQEEISQDEAIQSYLVDPGNKNGEVDRNDTTALINIIRLTGPMTRSGDACSYGSMDHRDMLMAYADNPRVAAHIIYTNTPGGMSTTLRDYRQAINYCHERGQKVYMYCDGDVASGGAFLACICDEVWANNAEDEIGSLGMFCAFFSLKDGAENKITSEIYHEMYADASTDKNGWYRHAVDGDMDPLRDDLNNSLAQILADAKKDRPSVKAEQMSGKMYKMGNVVGSLVDRIGSLGALCKYALSEHTKRHGAKLPRKEQAESPKQNTKTKSKHQNQMKTYTHFPAMIGETSMESQTDGYVSLNAEQADQLEHRAEEMALMVRGFQSLSGELESANLKVETLTSDLTEAREQLSASQNNEDKEALSQVQTELNTCKENLVQANETIEELRAELATANAQVEEQKKENANLSGILQKKETELQNATQQAADLQQTLESVNHAPGKQPQAGKAPETNGTTVSNPQFRVNAFKWNPALSAAENAELKRQHDERLKAYALGGRK